MATGVGINVSHTFFTKFVTNAGFGYEYDSYNVPMIPTNGKNRKDNNYTANAGLNYNWLDWLTLGLTYSLYCKDSNYATENYTVNEVTLWFQGYY